VAESLGKISVDAMCSPALKSKHSVHFERCICPPDGCETGLSAEAQTPSTPATQFSLHTADLMVSPWTTALGRLGLTQVDSLFCNPPFDRESIARVLSEIPVLVNTGQVRVAFVIVPFGPKYGHLQDLTSAVKSVPLYSAVLSTRLNFDMLTEPEPDSEYGTHACSAGFLPSPPPHLAAKSSFASCRVLLVEVFARF
jgi:hypothetical protein